MTDGARLLLFLVCFGLLFATCRCAAAPARSGLVLAQSPAGGLVCFDAEHLTDAQATYLGFRESEPVIVGGRALVCLKAQVVDEAKQ